MAKFISIIIIIGCLLFGYIAFNYWNRDNEPKLKEIENATSITDNEEFKDALKNNIGPVFVYGNLKAINPVSIKELDGEYMYIIKAKELQTEKTSYIHTGKSVIPHKTYKWVEIDREEWVCDKISFLGIEFDGRQMTLPDAKKIKVEKASEDVRYVYYSAEIEYTGTLYTTITNNRLSKDSKFFANKGINEARSIISSYHSPSAFWIPVVFLLILISIACYCFLW